MKHSAFSIIKMTNYAEDKYGYGIAVVTIFTLNFRGLYRLGSSSRCLSDAWKSAFQYVERFGN